MIREGIKLTGMPAWKFRMSEAELWAVVAFLREMPRLSPAQYQAIQSAPFEPGKDFPESPTPMVRWLRAPPEVNPRTAMPDLGVSERDARDIAAYLSTLK